MEEPGEMEKTEPVRRDHGCFGCGEDNPCGLQLRFESAGAAEVQARYVPRKQDEGFFGVVHGGIVTAMLDEAMAWAAFEVGAWAMTARIEVRFRRPVLVGDDLRVVGRVINARGRLIEATAEVRGLDDDSVRAEGAATFLRVPEAQAEAWRDRYLGPGAASS